jgi:hypothetical protein
VPRPRYHAAMTIDDAIALLEKLRAFNRPLRKAEVAGLEVALAVLAASGRVPGNDLAARTIYAKLTERRS